MRSWAGRRRCTRSTGRHSWRPIRRQRRARAIAAGGEARRARLRRTCSASRAAPGSSTSAEVRLRLSAILAAVIVAAYVNAQGPANSPTRVVEAAAQALGGKDRLLAIDRKSVV